MDFGKTGISKNVGKFLEGNLKTEFTVQKSDQDLCVNPSNLKFLLKSLFSILPTRLVNAC